MLKIEMWTRQKFLLSSAGESKQIQNVMLGKMMCYNENSKKMVCDMEGLGGQGYFRQENCLLEDDIWGETPE